MSEFREILSAEFISITGGLLAGILLAGMAGRLELIPGLLVLIPGFLEMRGNISGSLSARLVTALYLGTLKPTISGKPLLVQNVLAALSLSVVVSALLGVGAFGIIAFTTSVLFYKIIAIAVIAGLLTNVIEIPSTVALIFWLFRRGYDPNNIMGPYLTTSGDIVSLISLAIATVIV